MSKFALVMIVLGFGGAFLARAGQPLDYFLPAGTNYDPKVPTPEQFFGFQVGDWHLHSELVTAYLRSVANAAPTRAKLETLGRTHEGKPLVVLTLTSPENHERLEEIRMQHLALLDPAKNGALDAAKMPVVINLGYSIHGNEPSGVNAVVLLIYHLAAAQGPEVTEKLRHAVILIEPQRNPDGGDRAAQWFNQHRSLSAPSADPVDREHNEAWPRGRFNHYWFDPNRDWLPLVHPEARARVELFHRWRPNLLTDHHEMGTNNTLFFQPGVRTRNNPGIPNQIVELTGKVAAFHQRALDGKATLYYNEQGFDDFYPGKGSTYPDLHGTVGILFEQASARGHAQESDNGVLTFPFAIRNHVLMSLSSIEAAVALRTELLTLQKEFPKLTAELAARSPIRAYIFGDDGDPARAWAFLDLLVRHRIDVRPLNEEVSAGDNTFRPGAAWVARTDQAQFRLLSEMFVRRTKFEDNVFYDVSAWTLPFAFNLPFAELDKLPTTGDALATVPSFPVGKLIGGHSHYAYLFSWNGYFASRALHRLQQAGVLVKGLTGASLEAIAADGTRATFAPGTVLVPVGLQPDKASLIRATIDTIVKEDAIAVYGHATGLTPRGVDFGSASFVPLALPKVALITGQGVAPQSAGSAWHVLDQRVRLAPTLLDVAQLGSADLGRYNVVILVDGSYDALSEATVAACKRWVGDGGTLILMGRAMQWAAKRGIATLEVASANTLGDPSASGKKPEATAPVRHPYGSASEREALSLVAGIICAASIDTTHPLGYGFNGERLALCRSNTLVLKPAKSPYETPTIYSAQPLLSGYASDAAQKAIAQSAAAVALALGKGAVVAMPDDPNFRGFWYGGNRMFLNAVFYGRAIQPIRTDGDGGSDDLDAHSH